MFCLIRRQPDAAPFGALAAEARALAAGYGETADDEAADVLAANLLQAFTVSESLIEFRASAPRFTLEPGARPLASPWARRQAESGGDVTNLRHERILLAPEEARLLRLLDGARDRTALQSAFGAPGFDAILQKLAYAGLLARQ
jgi:hypothetical protein